MPESPLGRPADTTIIRTPRVTIKVDRWDWSIETYRDTLDITHAVMSYNWTNTIKSPSGGATITLLPQNAVHHFLDDIRVLDVIKIYEFGILKWMGYIRRIGSSGYIESSGEPRRTSVFQCTSFGGYLLESIVSINMQVLRNNLGFQQSAEDLANNLAKAGNTGLTYNQEVSYLIDAWFTFINDTVGTNVQSRYIGRYVDFTSGMTQSETPGYPRELFLFYGEEDELNLWSVLEKLAEAPLNEFFFDVGPRTVHSNGIGITLTEDKTYLIGRPTPFDGAVTVSNGVESPPQNRFQSITSVVIPQQYLTRYDLNKSMDEVFSLYLTAPVIYDMSRLELLADGREIKDDLAYKKYLYRLCNKPLYYVTLLDHEASTEAATARGVADRALAVSKTLYNWYRYNDEYLSGTISYMVPERSNNDPRIGDKMEIEGVVGSFYVEGLSHTWTYGGSLEAVATVTRGWNVTQPIKLSNRIFNRPKSAFWELDMTSV